MNNPLKRNRAYNALFTGSCVVFTIASRAVKSQAFLPAVVIVSRKLNK